MFHEGYLILKNHSAYRLFKMHVSVYTLLYMDPSNLRIRIRNSDPETSHLGSDIKEYPGIQPGSIRTFLAALSRFTEHVGPQCKSFFTSLRIISRVPDPSILVRIFSNYEPKSRKVRIRIWS